MRSFNDCLTTVTLSLLPSAICPSYLLMSSLASAAVLSSRSTETRSADGEDDKVAFRIGRGANADYSVSSSRYDTEVASADPPRRLPR